MITPASRITLESDGRRTTFDCERGDTLLRSALRAGLSFPYECGVGACGTCRAEKFEGSVTNLWESASGLSARERSRGRVLACQSVPEGDCHFRVRLGTPSAVIPRPRRRLLRLEERRLLTADMVELVFSGEGPADFLPGQYALFDFAGVEGSRAYSMSNTPNAEGHWHFIVRRTPNGAGSNRLCRAIGLGDRVQVDGPYGRAFYQSGIARDLLCIAGGSGLAPVLSVARAAMDRNIHFYYGGRTVDDLCARPYLETMAGFGSRLRYFDAISQPANDHCPGNVGFIHELVDRQLGAASAAFEIYMAGPPPMLQAAIESLVMRHKVPMEQLHYDRFF